MSNLSDFVPTGDGSGGGGGELYTVSWSAPVAAGGETELSPPYSFTKALVFINGAGQDETRGAFTIENNTITLSEPMETGDEAQVIVGQVFPPGTSDWNLITSDTEAEVDQKILMDSSGGTFTITLPADPDDGVMIDLIDVGNSLSSNAVTLAGNGKLIMGIDDDLVLDTNLVSLQLLYGNDELGWRIRE